MKKIILYCLFGIILVTASSFAVHKFYMAIYQVNYAPEKKMIQITSRIFIDDLDKALENKYNKKLYLGTDKETVEGKILLLKYLSSNFSIKVNGQLKTITFLKKEVDGDVLVCYSTIKDISKINSIEVFNSILIDWSSDQQNVTHVTVFETKNTLLLTESSRSGMLKY